MVKLDGYWFYLDATWDDTIQFNNEDVELDKLNKIIEAGRYAPTASNRQSNRYIIIRDKIDEVRELAINTSYEIANDPKGSTDYRKSSITMYEDYKYKNIDRLFFNAPKIIVIVSEDKAGFAEVNGGIAASRMEIQANSFRIGSLLYRIFKKGVYS